MTSETSDRLIACYGRKTDKLEACATCEERPWCLDARDPALKSCGSSQPGPTGDDAAYELETNNHSTLSFQPAPLTDEQKSDDRLTDLLRRIIEASDRRPDRIAIIMLRLAGYGTRDIAPALEVMRGKKTRQAVEKDIYTVTQADEVLGDVIHRRYISQKIQKTDSQRIIEKYRELISALGIPEGSRISDGSMKKLVISLGFTRGKVKECIRRYLARNCVKTVPVTTGEPLPCQE